MTRAERSLVHPEYEREEGPPALPGASLDAHNTDTEPPVCAHCCGTARLADAPCLACGGSGIERTTPGGSR